jgi:hypothetical protein
MAWHFSKTLYDEFDTVKKNTTFNYAGRYNVVS